MHFKAWHDVYTESHDEKKERKLARQLMTKHWFNKLKAGAKICKKKEGIKGNMLHKQRQFYQFNSKRRAVQLLF